MIRKCKVEEFQVIYEIINDAAIAYKGVIPEDRWKEPYMNKQELEEQIRDGVEFYCFEEDDDIIGVMGIQAKGNVKLIRHAYVKTKKRKGGIGTKLLMYLKEETDKPILIGTWKAALWAISFYEKNGFKLVSEEEKTKLLKKYWIIPERQVETSVVLVEVGYNGLVMKTGDLLNYEKVIQ